MKAMLPPLVGFIFFAIAAVRANDAIAPAPGKVPPGELPWQRAIGWLKKSERLVASKVVTQLTVRDGSDVFLGSIESVDVSTFTGKDSATTWVNVSKKTVGTPGFTMELDLHLEDAPSGILDGYATWTDRGVASFAGRPAGRWEGVAEPAENGTALAYLDPETAKPSQVDLVFPLHSNLGTRQVSVTVIFGPGPGDAWVPVSAVIDQSGRFMFWRRHLIITKIFQDWAERGSTKVATSPVK